MSTNSFEDMLQKLVLAASPVMMDATVDLHGLSPEQANIAVNRHLTLADQMKTNTLRFVTGRGNHLNAKGERGTLFHEFPNWLTPETLKNITKIQKGIGHYDLSIKSSPNRAPERENFNQFFQKFVSDNQEKIKRLAQENNAQEQSLLAYCYEYGIVLPQSYQNAFYWYKKSAENHYSYGEYALGGCYWKGQGVLQSDTKAIEFFERAEVQNNAWAAHQLGDIYYYAVGVKEDKNKARNYYKKASDLGLDIAKRKLAHIYFFGRGVEANHQLGFSLYKAVADNGDAHSAYNVACAYQDGLGTTQNDVEAFRYAKQAADGNDPDAQYLVAGFYGMGFGTEPNEELSHYYLQKAADNNYKHALLHLALRLSITQKELSLEYLIKAAKAEQIIAQAMVLTLFPDNTLSATDREHISHSFWNQDDEELLNIPEDNFKFIAIDAYMMSENFTKKQKSKVMCMLTMLCNANYPEAYGRMGGAYHLGEIVQKSEAQAESFWKKGAQLNDPGSLCSLGYLYEEKAKTDPSFYEQVFEYHFNAAKLNNANSCCQLGSLYRYGHGVTKNILQAVYYYEKAMYLDSDERKSSQKTGLVYRSTYPHAAYNLAMVYWRGEENFPADKAKAALLFKMAANTGQNDAKKIVTLLNLPKINATSQFTYRFWKPEAKVTSSPQSLDSQSLLKEWSTLLGLTTNWKINNKDQAWSYIENNELHLLEKYDLIPITLRKAVNGKHLLLLENISKQDVSELVTKIQGQIAANIQIRKQMVKN